MALNHSLPLHFLPCVRLCQGDFCYSEDEFEVICDDVREALKAGASGVVVGFLTRDGQVDVERMQTIIDIATSACACNSQGCTEGAGAGIRRAHAQVPGGTHAQATETKEVTATSTGAASRLPPEITFHRAFDMCADASKALAQLRALGDGRRGGAGVHRVLTSGP